MTDKKTWDDIKQKGLKGFDVFKSEFSKVTKEFQKQGSIVKKKMDHSSLQRMIQQNYTRLGSRVFELVEQGKKGALGTDGEVSSIIDQITAHKEEAEKLLDEIEKIRKEKPTPPEEEGPQKQPPQPKTPIKSSAKKPEAEKEATEKTEEE
jgi:hypothetical protein